MKKLIVFIILIIIIGCTSKNDDTVWIYSATPPDETNALAKAISEKFPGADVQWYAQGGSENVQARIAMEEMSGKPKVNIVMTADMFWFENMAKQGLFSEYKPTIDYKIPKLFSTLNPDYSVMKVNVIGIAYNKKFLRPEDAPKSFKDLIDPKFKGKIACGSPLESGTNYMLMTNLAHKYGYDFLKQLRANDLSSTGGNFVTVRRMISGERPIGILPIELIVLNKEKEPNLEVVYPDDGSIVIPAAVGITKNTKNMDVAKRIVDFIVSDQGQQIAIKYGAAYGVNSDLTPPAGIRSLGEILTHAFPIDKGLFSFVQTEGEKFKDKYSEIMFAP